MQKPAGYLLAFDGLDSSGKATQTKLLIERLRRLGWKVLVVQSPDYLTPSGQELKARLQNKLGDWTATPWQEKMKYFSLNRTEHREEVVSWLRQGNIVVYDRYVPSSMAFMAVEALNPQKAAMFRHEIYSAVEREEYRVNRMPHEDVSIFLDVPPRLASALLEKRKEITKDQNEYTDHLAVQERLYNEYDVLCTENPKRFLRIKCVEGVELLGIEDTAELVWTGLKSRFPALEKNHN